MRESIAAREASGSNGRCSTRLAARVEYLQGDFTDPATYERVRELLAGARNPLFYLETPPALFGPIVTRLGQAGLTSGARVLIEKPFGHDLASARALAAELHRTLREEQIFRVDHFLGKLGLGELLYLRYANTILEPVWNAEHVSSLQITMAERFGVEDRGRFYDAVGALRDVVVNHLLQLTAAATMDAPRKGETLDDARYRLLRSMSAVDPARYVRGQYAGYHKIPGVAPSSTTETFAALELQIDSERWRGVPVYVRTGKHLPITQTEVRLIFRDASPPPSSSRGEGARSGTSSSSASTRSTGIRLVIEAHRAGFPDGPGAGHAADMEFAEQGGEQVRPPTRSYSRPHSRCGDQLALHPPGDGRRSLAHRRAAPALPQAHPRLPQGELGAPAGARRCSDAEKLARALGAFRPPLAGRGRAGRAQGERVSREAHERRGGGAACPCRSVVRASRGDLPGEVGGV